MRRAASPNDIAPGRNTMLVEHTSENVTGEILLSDGGLNLT